MNDICNVSDVLRFILFADDTNGFKSGFDLNELADIITYELDKLQIWFNTNKLSLNVSKTKFMIFGNIHNKGIDLDKIKVYINGYAIERVTSIKFLGVIIDSNLNWHEQISKVSDKLSKSLAILYKVRYILDKSSLLTIYNSLFLPYLSYCCEVWGNTYESKLRCLYLKQKRAVRIINNVDYYSHTNGLFIECDIVKFFELVKLKSACMMYKAYHNSLPLKVQTFFQIGNCIDFYSTRQQNKFRVNFVRTTMKANCLSVAGVRVWNELPQIIRSSYSMNAFKNEVKQYYINSYKSI